MVTQLKMEIPQLIPSTLVSFRSGTLPLPHHYPSHHPRSVSLDHTATLAHFATPPPATANAKPAVVLQQQQQRPGYVTLPRRPRGGWSAVPRDTPSPAGSTASAAATANREPIYDGIGPRTSADGSSRLNLNKSQPQQQPPMQQQQQHMTLGRRGQLPPYCAPIQELADDEAAPSTPNKKQRQNAGVNTKNNNNNQSMASIATTSGSEVTLIEESISAYMEPFGKALLPPDNENDVSAASNGFKSSTPMRNGGDGDKVGNGQQQQPPMPAARKQAPKTLPKPKVSVEVIFNVLNTSNGGLRKVKPTMWNRTTGKFMFMTHEVDAPLCKLAVL